MSELRQVSRTPGIDPPVTPIYEAPIKHPTAWKVVDFRTPADYTIELTATHLREIERALQREEREGRNILFPVRIDDYIFEKWEHARKSDVVAKVIGDFRGWDRGAVKYRESFERLLKTLQSATTEKPPEVGR